MNELAPVIVALLALLILGAAWLGFELRSLNASLGPIANSNLARGIASL